MTVTFDLPSNIERALRQEFADLNHAAKESALVELYSPGEDHPPRSVRGVGPWSH